MLCSEFGGLEYQPDTGLFFWRKSGRGRKSGVPAGNIDKSSAGYVRIYVSGKRHQAHRLAWRFFYGSFPAAEMDIDHVNGIRSDNRISNLRLATRAQNAINSGIYSSNTVGLKGVSRAGNAFVSTATVNGATCHLGRYKTAEQAHVVYRKFVINKFGEYTPKEFL